MGKYKGNKPKIRSNPVGIASMKEVMFQETEGFDPSSDSSFVPTLIDQLKSHLREERDNGLNSLSIACQNKRLLEELLEADIVKIASTLLVDASDMVRHTAAGALRNMSMVSPAICDLMVTQDVMTPLVALLKQQYSSDWQPGKKKEGKIDTVTETFVQAINLLWNLCENNDTALNIFNREGLVNIVLKGLNIETYGLQVALPVAQLLHAVTEDNPDIIAVMEPLQSIFERIIVGNDGDGVDRKYLQALSVGILLNLKQGRLSRISTDNLALYLKVLSSPLSVDNLEEIQKIRKHKNFEGRSRESGFVGKTAEGEQVIRDNGTNGMDMELSSEPTFEDEFQTLNNLLNSQILSLTIFSNIIIPDDEFDDASDDESGESVTDFNGDGDDVSMELDEGLTNGLIPEVHEIIIAENLRGKILDKIKQMDISTLENLSKNEHGVKILRLSTQLRSTALICYQNLVGSFEMTELGGLDETEAIFSSLALAVFEEIKGDAPQGRNLNLIEAITSVQRAIIQKWTEGAIIKPISWFSADNLAVFAQVYQSVAVGKIHTNLIKIIGGYGILLSKIRKDSSNVEIVSTLLGQVGEFLLRCVCDPFEKDHLPVVAEALDTIFDVFAEDDYNDVLRALGLIEKLKKFLPTYKKFIQNQRRELGEHKAIIQTSKQNLSRFIYYKIKHGCA